MLIELRDGTELTDLVIKSNSKLFPKANSLSRPSVPRIIQSWNRFILQQIHQQVMGDPISCFCKGMECAISFWPIWDSIQKQELLER